MENTPITRSIRRGMAWVMNMAGSTVTISGTAYKCFQGDRTARKDLEPEGGGFVADFDVVFFVERDDFSTLPAIGDKVTDEDSNSFRIVQTITSDQDPFIALLCEGVNK